MEKQHLKNELKEVIDDIDSLIVKLNNTAIQSQSIISSNAFKFLYSQTQKELIEVNSGILLEMQLLCEKRKSILNQIQNIKDE